MKCPRCGTEMVIELNLFGGCQGHEPGDRCYCSDPDVRAVYHCVRRREYTQRGRQSCKQDAIPIRLLSDQYAIARWLTAHYDEDPAQ